MEEEIEKESLFGEQDLEQLEARGISLDEAKRQVESIRSGFPFLNIIAPASLERGIIRIERDDEVNYMEIWQNYLDKSDGSVCKFVPASGAASRMFKSLYTFLEGEDSEPQDEAVQSFFEELSKFAFYNDLNETCLRNDWKVPSKLIAQGDYKKVLENLLLAQGLNYGASPKGLIPFHKYGKGACTAAEEHLVEGASYIRDKKGVVKIHFTVSPEHQARFIATLERNIKFFERKFGITYQLSFSEQKASTDTLALRPDGSLFRLENEKLLFRPGGHGALIENLNDLSEDIVFIKNIDNVVPDQLKGSTIIYKKFLGGILLSVQKEIHHFLDELEKGRLGRSKFDEITRFLDETLCIKTPEEVKENNESYTLWLKSKLDRPLRVCGTVRNQGEAGGGPFLIKEADGSTSLQILESTQINMQDEEQRELFESSTHFNPVDIVCSLKRPNGESYNLLDYVNHKTAFIASKSLNGQELKALERPGLWNGAMYNWNTLFVEVPIETFNPVKEVNDLLRFEHQGV